MPNILAASIVNVVNMSRMAKGFGKVCAVIGGQWGDEGKGKLVDILAEQYDYIVRATGGANAGHTIYLGEDKFVFHLVPAGMLHPGKICVVGNGMVVHFPTLIEELDILAKAKIKVGKRLVISDRAHVVFEYRKLIDRVQEERKGAGKVGTTGRGIGPAYADKTSRIGIRAGELLDFEAFSERYRKNLEMHKAMYGFEHDGEAELRELKKMLPRIAPCITDTSFLIADVLKKKKTVLLEGANGTLLDIDHGTFPFVTSSNASLGGIVTGSGIAANKIENVVGIMKAYLTRVGSGPFPTELDNELGASIRTAGNEFGATTGRPRRCGWFDAVGARYAVRINGLTAINLTKIDVLTGQPHLKIGIAYTYKGKRYTEFPADVNVLTNCEVEYKMLPGWKEDTSKARTFKQLPKNCQRYILTLEKLVGCKMVFIGTGRSREQMLRR